MKACFSILVVFFAIGITSIAAQRNNEKDASKLFEKGKYVEALDILKRIDKDNKEHYLKRGICNYHARDLDNALLDLTSAYEKGEDSGILLNYLAKTHHLRGEYYEAARAYKMYLNEVDRNDPERKAIVHAIKNCNYGRKAIYREQAGFVENLGSVVNTRYDEVAPVRSPNFDTRYYYSSNRSGSTGGLRNSKGLKDDLYGRYSHDIYAIEKAEGKWIEASGVPPLLNSARDEIIQGFNDNGRVIIFIKSGHSQGAELVADTFSIDLNSKPFFLYTPANANLGDKDLFFINDSTFLFSSKRKGGYGGYDLYYTTYNQGKWEEPINLGPEINSPFDEETPYLSNSNTILYFSSNRVESLGGYDIYSASYGIERGQWLPAENLGFPISSPGDDKYFRLSADGRSAIFASDRKESMGGYDLFVAYLKFQVYEQLAQASSVPFINRVPTNKDIASSDQDPAIEEGAENTRSREIVIRPLMYENSDVLSNGNNAKALKDLLDMMVIFPETKAIVTGHTHYGGSKAYDLYFSIKNAEQVRDYFISNGIAPDRIVVYGTGSNYPMVKSLGTNLATKNNNRIEILLNNIDGERLNVTYTYPIINDYLKDERGSAFREVYNGTIFRIAVAKSNQMYDNPNILSLDNIIIERETQSSGYLYTVGNCLTYKQALDLKNILTSRGIQDIEMHAYLDGVRLNPLQIQNLTANNPEIKAFADNELK